MAAPAAEDRFKISDIMVRYTTCLDAGDTEGVVSCFTPDGVVDSPISGSYEGHERIRFFASRNADNKKQNGAQLRHVISNMVIDVQGDRAQAQWYLLDFLTIRGKKTELLSPGQYDCELVRIGDEWLIKRRTVRMDHRFSLPWAPAPKAKEAKAKRTGSSRKSTGPKRRTS